MSYKMRLKKYMRNENERNNPNPYQKIYDERDKKTSEMYGMWFKPCAIGVDGFDDCEPHFYIEFEEVQDEMLLKCRKATKQKTRVLKAVIKEVEDQDIEIKKIVPLFNLDSDDLTEILTGEWRDGEFSYLSKDEERFEKDGDSYIQDTDETFNYFVEVECLVGTKCFVLKELEDLEYIPKELLEVK